MAQSRDTWRVGLFIGSTSSHEREALLGISRYAFKHGPWHFYHQHRRKFEPKELLKFDGDGLLIYQSLPRWLREACRVPIVNLVQDCGPDPDNLVAFDNRAIGRLAGEHLRELGLERFGFVGYRPAHRGAAERYAGFLEAVGQDASEVPYLEVPDLDDPVEQRIQRTVRWLPQLGFPVGVFAFSDRFAEGVIEAAHRLGVRVPDDVAVVGADNDEASCEFTHPPLSSVDPAAESLGYHAAATLDQLMKGEIEPPVHRLIKPQGLVARGSSDVLFVDDEKVVAAVRFIREFARGGLSVGEVVDHVGISRSSLERRFRAARGLTINDEIQRVRLAYVKELLERTSLPLAEIAARAGFNYVPQLCAFVKRHTGKTASQIRGGDIVVRSPA